MSDESRLPQTAHERGRIAPHKFAHCVLRTKQLPEMVRWYRTVLEAEIVHENPMLAFMTYDDEHHRIAILSMPHLIARPAARQLESGSWSSFSGSSGVAGRAIESSTTPRSPPP